MAKTVELTFKCEKSETYPDDYNKLRVTVEMDNNSLNKLLASVENDLLQYAKDNYDPEGVFSDEQLQKWAESNGFVKEAP